MLSMYTTTGSVFRDWSKEISQHKMNQICLFSIFYNNSQLFSLSQEHSATKTGPPSSKNMQDANIHSINPERQEPCSSRRSLDFNNHAEKPFVENQVTIVTESPPMIDDSVSDEKPAEQEKARRVQFATGTLHEPKTESKIKELNSKLENKVELANRSSYPEDRNVENTRSASEASKVGSRKQARPPSPQRHTDHLRILAYLFGELRAILASAGM